jgi:hypothetical protein
MRRREPRLGCTPVGGGDDDHPGITGERPGGFVGDGQAAADEPATVQVEHHRERAVPGR